MDTDAVIQANVSVYPLLQTDYRGVHRAIEALERSGLDVRAGTTATTILGGEAEVFDALREAFAAARETGPTVMTVTVTDACPLPAGG